MSEQHTAENDAHAPTVRNGRTVCTCGDFNCASLDAARCGRCGRPFASQKGKNAHQGARGNCGIPPEGGKP